MGRIGIIGAGPAGIIAAVEAKRKGAEVMLCDSNSRIGKKLLVTGSGRCNLSNTGVSSERYITGDRQFVERVLARFGYPELIAYMNDLGILTHATDDGWVYPVSNSAANVVGVLEAHLKDLEIEFMANWKLQDIRKNEAQFTLTSSYGAGSIMVERVILASGGCASPMFGSTGDIFKHVEKFGHRVIPLYPALAPLETDRHPFHKLQGVRMDLGVKILHGEKALGESIGNVIFTEWGVNGPGVMDLSHLVDQYPENSLMLELNFLPIHENDLNLLFRRFKSSAIPLQTALEMVLPSKVAGLFSDRSNLSIKEPLRTIPEITINRLMFDLTHASVQIRKTRGFVHAQISAGGADVSQINPEDMQSTKAQGLYFAGEIMDVAGLCGGFNLHWAFSSGFIAGTHAGDF